MVLRFLPALLCLAIPCMAYAADTPVTVILTAPAPLLIGLGLLVMLLEFAMPTKGALGVLGAVLFIIGTSSLPNNPVEILRLSWPLVILMDILVLGTLGAIAYITIHGYNRNDAKTTQPYIGQIAHVVEWTEDSKRIDYAGSIWQAATHTHEHYKKGDRVEIVAQNNLTFYVSRPTTGHGESK